MSTRFSKFSLNVSVFLFICFKKYDLKIDIFSRKQNKCFDNPDFF